MWSPVPNCLACLVARVLLLASSLLLVALLLVGCGRASVEPFELTITHKRATAPIPAETPEASKPGGS